MAVLRKPGSVVRCVLPEEENSPEEERTVWCMRVLSYAERSELESLVVRPGEANRGARAILNKALDSVENLRDEDGEEIEVERDPRGRLTEGFLDKMAVYVTDVAALALDAQRMKTGTAKNY